MPTVTVTAAEDEKLQIRTQKRVMKTSVVQTQGFDENGEPSVVSSFGPKVATWPDVKIDHIAAESRAFEIDGETRIVVEPFSG